MVQVFKGDVILPGDGGPGLQAAMTLEGETVTLQTGDEVLGTWNGSNILVQPGRHGQFLVTLGGEDLYFKPESPSEFATAMTAPLQGGSGEGERKDRATRRAEKKAEKAEKKLSAEDEEIIEKVVSSVKPLRSLDEEDDILTPGLLSGIVVIAVLIVAAVVGVSVLV